MSQDAVKKQSKRARVFELMQQKNQALLGQARIRKLARKDMTAHDLESFKMTAMQSLQANHRDLPAKNF